MSKTAIGVLWGVIAVCLLAAGCSSEDPQVATDRIVEPEAEATDSVATETEVAESSPVPVSGTDVLEVPETTTDSSNVTNSSDSTEAQASTAATAESPTTAVEAPAGSAVNTTTASTAGATATTATTTSATTTSAATAATASTAPSTTAPTAAGSSAASCDAIAAAFVTKGSANADLPDPEVSATCNGDTVTVNSNQIPDFPYIETSPGDPSAFDISFTIPASPTAASSPSDIAAVGAIAVAINGIPIYGATEGTGGDVFSLGGGFTECGGHNGPTGYHYHTFDVTGSAACLFSAAEASAGPVLFGYAFDGYPIYSGNFQYTSSWQLTDESLFATDTFAAHTYNAGSGDLDRCNGRTDSNGNYAYYTTDTFPYTLGCYYGIVDSSATGGGNGGPPGGGNGGPPPPGG